MELLPADAPIRVLLIDSDPAEYALLGTLLDAVGHTTYELTWCRRFEHAPDAIAADLHDVILLDFQSDRQGAHALLLKAVQQGCPRPIIVMTAEMDPNVDREAVRGGASDYLQKGRIDSQLLERSIVLDAADRPALLTELRGLGLAPDIDPAGLVRVGVGPVLGMHTLGPAQRHRLRRPTDL
jgi:DNA-binding NtrC family response regulator